MTDTTTPGASAPTSCPRGTEPYVCDWPHCPCAAAPTSLADLAEALDRSAAEAAAMPLSDEARLILALEERGDALSVEAAGMIEVLLANFNLTEWHMHEAEKRAAALKALLRPFAEACEPWTESWSDETPLRIGLPGYQKSAQFTLGDVRRVRATLKEAAGHE